MGVQQLRWFIPKHAYQRMYRLKNANGAHIRYMASSVTYNNMMRKIAVLTPSDMKYHERALKEVLTYPKHKGHLCFLVGGKIVNRFLSGWTGMDGHSLVNMLRLRFGTMGAIEGAPSQPTCHNCNNGTLATLAIKFFIVDCVCVCIIVWYLQELTNISFSAVNDNTNYNQ